MIRVYKFDSRPELVFELDGLLFAAEDLSGAGVYESKRADRLYEALGVSSDDLEYSLLECPDGRWALVGMQVEGHSFAVEEHT